MSNLDKTTPQPGPEVIEPHPPFNEFTTCTACGYRRGPETKPLVQYCEACPHFGEAQPRAPHLHRQCGRCGFIWPEATNDTPQPAGRTTTPA